MMFVPRVGQNNINVRYGSPESASYTQLPRGDFFKDPHTWMRIPVLKWAISVI